MIDGYFKLTASNSTERTGEFFFFDSQDVNSVHGAWDKAARKSRMLDGTRPLFQGRKQSPSRITHWGWPPMRGPWSGCMHIGVAANYVSEVN